MAQQKWLWISTSRSCKMLFVCLLFIVGWLRQRSSKHAEARQKMQKCRNAVCDEGKEERTRLDFYSFYFNFLLRAIVDE